MIHSTAIIDSKARIDGGAEIGPYCVIGPDVSIGAGTVMHSNVVVQGHTSIGERNDIYPFAVIGTIAQHATIAETRGRVVIGSDNVIREHAMITQPIYRDAETRIGNHNLIMGSTLVAHDTKVGDHVVITFGSALSGHVVVEDHVVIGGQVGTHQFIRIGAYAMVGGKAALGVDVPPYSKVYGVPARFAGINAVGLERGNISKDIIADLKSAFEVLYSDDDTAVGLERVAKEIPASQERDHLISFIRDSERGVCRP
jgi:UDP-N-acetylglucosamine acyltransferase